MRVSRDLPTPQFQPVPSVMVVGLDEPRAAICARVVAPLPVLRVAHAQAAFERMLVTWPLVLVLRETAAADEVTRLREGARQIGAEIVHLTQGVGEAALEAMLHEALARAESKRAEAGEK
jgi:hypothetical protein